MRWVKFWINSRSTFQALRFLLIENKKEALSFPNGKISKRNWKIFLETNSFEDNNKSGLFQVIYYYHSMMSLSAFSKKLCSAKIPCVKPMVFILRHLKYVPYKGCLCRWQFEKMNVSVSLCKFYWIWPMHIQK